MASPQCGDKAGAAWTFNVTRLATSNVLRVWGQVPDADFLGLKPRPSVTAITFVDPSDDRKVVVGGPGKVRSRRVRY